MAKVILGPTVSDVRNKIGNTVFTKVRFGNMIRVKVSPTQPRTARQVAQRSALTTYARGWDALTATEIAAWNAFAVANPVKDVFGQSIKLTGMQMYVRLNVAISNVGGTAITTPPADLSVTNLTSVTASATGGGTPAFSITAASPALGTNEVANIYATANLKAGRSNIQTFLRNILFNQSLASLPLDLLAAYSAKFGDPVTGSIIGLAVQITDSVTGAQSLKLSQALVVG